MSNRKLRHKIERTGLAVLRSVLLAAAMLSEPVLAQESVCSAFKDWWAKPGQIRSGKVIRLGGYFYAGRVDTAWIGQHFDLVDLNAKNDTNFVRMLRSVNPNIAVYQQFLLQQAVTRQTGAQAVGVPDEPSVEAWRLRKKDGSAASSPRGPNYLPMDFRGTSGWAEHFARESRRHLDLTHADGIVLDEVPLRLGFMTWSDLRDYATDEEVQEAIRQWLGDVRKALRAPILINVGALHGRDRHGVMLWDKFDRVIDGAWHEGWVRFYGAHDSPHDGNAWEADIGSLERFSAGGRPYIASAAFRNRDELEYGLANYLLAIKGPSGVFQPMWEYDPVTRGGFNLDIVRREVESNRDLFDTDLGCPTGDRQKKDGVWYRTFERGLVVVNASRRALNGSIPPGYSRVGGTAQPGRFKVEPFTGMVLVK